MKTTMTAASLFLITGAALAMTPAAWDADGDGVLSVDEFHAGFGALDTHGAFDGDGSGQLDELEWNTSLSSVGDFANMDLNGDGGVDADEYRAIMFNRYDSDGSATLDSTEIGGIAADLAEDGLLSGGI